MQESNGMKSGNRASHAKRTIGRLAGATAAAWLVAGCNSPMPPDRAGAPAAPTAQTDDSVIGANKAVQMLALPPAKPLAPNPEYARFPRYVGTLGDRQVEMRLGPKEDEPSGVHGEYRFAGSSAVILVAGDRDGDTLEIEESNDGTHITGNWIGKFAADGSVSGERMNPDDSDPQPFDLRPAVAGATVPANRANASRPAKPAAPSLEPAPAPAPPPRNAVGGTSNVIIGE
jgi:hypothetical protein